MYLHVYICSMITYLKTPKKRIVIGIYIHIQSDIYPPSQLSPGISLYTTITVHPFWISPCILKYTTTKNVSIKKNCIYKPIHSNIFATILSPSISMYIEIFVHISVPFNMHKYKTSYINKNGIYKHIHGDNGTLLSPCILIYNAILQNIPLCLLPFIYIYTSILYFLKKIKIIFLISFTMCLYKTIIPSK